MRIKALITSALFLLPVMTIRAQVMSPLSDGEQAAYLNFGLDPAVITTWGYTRGFEAGFMNRDIMISAELAIPVAKLDLKDYRLKIGAQARIVNYKGWDISVPIHLILRGTQNWMHSATSFGADFAGLFGYCGKSWFANLEFGYDVSIITNITATDRYKKYYNPDFKDGWYGGTSSFFTRGLRAGYRIHRTEITIRAGQPIIDWSAESNDLVPPFYGILGVNYRF